MTLLTPSFLRRMIGAVILTVLALVTTAALIGFHQARVAHTPTAASLAILHRAEKAGGRNCRLEWNEAQGDHEVICDPATDLLTSIRALAARPARTTTNPDGSMISDPNGIALLTECLSDPTLSSGEVRDCITQP